MLRHATHLVQRGFALHTVGEVLGHQHPDSTLPFTKLAIDDLHDVALDVPEFERSFLSTQSYLTATPELMAEASRRFHDRFGALVRLQRTSMTLTDSARDLAQALATFFGDHLPLRTGASRHTVLAYRDAWKLFLRFAATHTKRPIPELCLTDLDVDTVLAFLDSLETQSAQRDRDAQPSAHGPAGLLPVPALGVPRPVSPRVTACSPSRSTRTPADD